MDKVLLLSFNIEDYYQYFNQPVNMMIGLGVFLFFIFIWASRVFVRIDKERFRDAEYLKGVAKIWQKAKFVQESNRAEESQALFEEFMTLSRANPNAAPPIVIDKGVPDVMRESEYDYEVNARRIWPLSPFWFVLSVAYSVMIYLANAERGVMDALFIAAILPVIQILFSIVIGGMKRQKNKYRRRLFDDLSKYGKDFIFLTRMEILKLNNAIDEKMEDAEKRGKRYKPQKDEIKFVEFGDIPHEVLKEIEQSDVPMQIITDENGDAIDDMPSDVVVAMINGGKSTWEFDGTKKVVKTRGIVNEGASAEFEYSTSPTFKEGTVLSEQPTDVGKYYVRVRLSPTTNYAEYLQMRNFASFEIVKKNQHNVIAVINNRNDKWDFDGEIKPVGASGNALENPDIIYEYSTTPMFTSNIMTEQPTGVGTYYVRLKLSPTKNYNEYLQPNNFMSFTIEKSIQKDIYAKINDGQKSWRFNGKPKTVSVVGNIAEGAIPIFEYCPSSDFANNVSSAQPTNVGTYYIRVKLTESESYRHYVQKGEYQAFTITKGQQENVTATINNGDLKWQYSGIVKPVSLNGIVHENALITYEYSTFSKFNNNVFVNQPLDSGVYYIRAKLNATMNYEAYVQNDNFVSFEIMKAGQVYDTAEVIYSNPEAEKEPEENQLKLVTEQENIAKDVALNVVDPNKNQVVEVRMVNGRGGGFIELSKLAREKSGLKNKNEIDAIGYALESEIERRKNKN
ncbi:MAG: hypothetical protein LBH47_00490 [Christensenellaceae bacterium]|jgi:hypothetical protein|nr:hypothetical protein [Christensenellaceae bacterium]